MLDLVRRQRAVGVNQHADAPRHRARDRNFRGVEYCHLVPPVGAGCPGGEGGDEVRRDGENRAHDIGGVHRIRLDQRTQQLIGGGEDFFRLIVLNRGRTPESA